MCKCGNATTVEIEDGERTIATVCDDCNAIAQRDLSEMRPIFEGLLDAGMSREMANAIMIRDVVPRYL